MARASAAGRRIHAGERDIRSSGRTTRDDAQNLGRGDVAVYLRARFAAILVLDGYDDGFVLTGCGEGSLKGATSEIVGGIQHAAIHLAGYDKV